MRITEIHVERYGSWRDLHLHLPQPGLSVLYGPNGTGKSTLLKFLRAMFYGFPPWRSPSAPAAFPVGELGHVGAGPWAGSLTLEHNGGRCVLRRAAQETGGGFVELSGAHEAGGADSLPALLQGVDEKFFESVFAVGLREIQELSALQSGAVADHIYGLTLGLEGQRLLTATGELRAARRRWLDPAANTGELARLRGELDDVDRRLADLAGPEQRYREVCAESRKTAAQIQDIERREGGIRSQLRGHMLLQRVWGPWNRVRECESQLAELSAAHGFPEHGLERLEKLDRDLAEGAQAREALLSRARTARQAAAKLSLDPEMRAHAGAIQGLLDQREAMQQIDAQLGSTQAQADALKADLDERLEKLGPPWTLKRLESVDVGPAGHFRLANLARSFRAALARRARLKRACQRHEAAIGERNAALSSLHTELGGRTLGSALAASRASLTGLRDLQQLRQEESAQEAQQLEIDRQLGLLEARRMLPNWVHVLLWAFCLSGVALALLGAVTGVRTSGHVGLIYMLLGATCGALSWALKLHFDSEIHERLAQLTAAADANLERLRRTRTAAQRQAAALDKLADSAGIPAGDRADLTQTLAAVEARVERLEAGQREVDQLDKLRARFEQSQHRLQLCEREVGTVRQSWQEWLSQLGFAPQLRIEEAFDSWRELVEAVELRRQREALLQQAAHYRGLARTFQQRIEELGRRLERWDLDFQQPLHVLQVWEEQLRAHSDARKTRRELRRERQARLREAAEYAALIQDLRTQRAALLVQAGAGNRDEFEQRADAAARRLYLTDQLRDARRDLDLAAQSDRDLAVVEEDLRRYDARQNGEHIDLLTMELEDLDRDRESAAAQLAALHAERTSLAADRTSADLRLQRAQLETQLERGAAEWWTLELADQALADVRGEFERTCQPVTLADASRYFTRLTCGQYRNVWTPLGERRLCVDDAERRAIPVEHLSRGTREQLFLAIRLALVQDLARRGTVLPLVLDDVLVNSDERRTAAAAELLQEFADRGVQVLLLTSHRHLADSFRTRGLEPVALPLPAWGGEDQPWERRAG